MILTLDVGNTNITIGLFKGERLIENWRIGTRKDYTSDEWASLLFHLFTMKGIERDTISGMVVASVVPGLIKPFRQFAQAYLSLTPLIVGPGMKTGTAIQYDNPKDVGADRIANAVGGFERYGGPLIIVDFGTATTVDAVREDGAYLGGAIAPGVMVATEALFSQTARLPRVELEPPSRAIGTNTADSLQSGIVFGFVGQVDYLVKRFRREFRADSVRAVATGGLAFVIRDQTQSIDVIDPDLTLHGLRLLYERNQ